MRLLLVTGPGTEFQGWGRENATRALIDAIRHMGVTVLEQFVSDLDEFLHCLDTTDFDLVWSSIYHFSDDPSRNGLADDLQWLPDILDERGIPYVGSSAETLKRAYNKSETINHLHRNGIPVPIQFVVAEGDPLPDIAFPAFVKPCFESESQGVDESSVVHSEKELANRIAYVHQQFEQQALVEEYLPGAEWTISVIGNGSDRIIRPVINHFDPSTYSKYPIITNQANLKERITSSIPNNAGKSLEIAHLTADAMGCLDHTRIDLREDKFGNLRVIEVNGIPGLDPLKSRAMAIHHLYEGLPPKEGYRSLIATILEAAIQRCGLNSSAIVPS